ncbi:MAG: VWA domain-containing protein, partial [Pseudomonadota bacterium]
QAAVSRLLDRHGTRPVALVVFAGESFLVGVPSAETRTLQGTVAVIDETTMPLPGSRPDRALALARLTLEDAGAERGDVVLVSDGGGIGPDAEVEARALAAAGARVSAVFAAPSTALQGAPPPRRTAMETIAETGDGLIVDARDVQPLESFLLEHRGVTAGEVERRALVFDDHGRWLVMAAALALLPLFRRRRTT